MFPNYHNTYEAQAVNRIIILVIHKVYNNCIALMSVSIIFTQWIMDFMICNGLGIWVGMLTCRYFSMKVTSQLNFFHFIALYVSLKVLAG